MKSSVENCCSSDDRCISLVDHDPCDEIKAPLLLLQPAYARSKKSLLLDDLRNFRISLKWCALDHSSASGKLISYATFTVLTVLFPLVTLLSVENAILVNVLVQFSESGLAVIGFLTMVCFFRKYGLRQLLLLDGLQDDAAFVTRKYSLELEKAFRGLASILLPSFLFELVHKIIFFSTVEISLPGAKISPSRLPLNSIFFLFGLVSWIYRTGVFVLVCLLFKLTCELQILRFGGLHTMFEGCGSNVAGDIFNEHVRIRRQLSGTSHRYRFFIIASLVVITASQFVALLLLLSPKSDNSFLNSGDLVICSGVQLSGFFLCLLGAARITHRAQGIVSIATKWHIALTLASSEHAKASRTDQNAELSDADSSDSIIYITTVSSSSQQISQCSLFRTRQALVEYLQHNNKGITLYGYALDRGLLHTLFAFEFSLVMWILSKVVVLS